MSFDTISPGPMVSVGELLGELSTIATLRIQILRPKTTMLQDIKDKLLRLLLIQSYNLLLRSGCPLDTVSLVFCILLSFFWIKKITLSRSTLIKRTNSCLKWFSAISAPFCIALFYPNFAHNCHCYFNYLNFVLPFNF